MGRFQAYLYASVSLLPSEYDVCLWAAVEANGAELNHNFGILPEEIREAVRAAAKEHGDGWKVPPFPAAMLAIPEESELAKLVAEKCTPHPLAALEEAVQLTGAWKGLPVKYVVTEEFKGFHGKAAALSVLLSDCLFFCLFFVQGRRRGRPRRAMR